MNPQANNVHVYYGVVLALIAALLSGQYHGSGYHWAHLILVEGLSAEMTAWQGAVGEAPRPADVGPE